MAFDQKQATGQLVHWVEDTKITQEVQMQAPRGLYLPVWTFDLFGTIPWNGMVYRDKRMVSVSGEKSIHFEDIRVLGSKKVSDLMTQALPEFDLHSASAYDARFLAGWMADVYDLPMAEASLEARRIAVEQVRGMIQAEFGHVLNLAYSTSALMVSSFKLVLVPAWIAEIRIHDRSAYVLINGRTGSVHSDIPAGGLAGWLGNMLSGR